jgi:precorrin-6Y C5,15-methyltransferase (decarboxylating)
MTGPMAPPAPNAPAGPVRPWLAVVGLHEDGLAGLGAAARALVDGAETLVGDARMLGHVAEDGRERLIWPKPLTALFPELARRRGRPVCVLASGDPLCHGIGALIARHFAPEDWRIWPAPSSLALACARLGWSQGEVDTLSLHHRPVSALLGLLGPGVRLVLLTRDGATPAAVAALLTERGYGASRLTVFERLAGPAERRLDGVAAVWPWPQLDELNVLAIDCVAGAGAVLLPAVPGWPDSVFASDGVMTKREVRALTVSALAPGPGPGPVLWDVGAGCGSVAIEWLRVAGPGGRAIAVERQPERLALIATNRERFGADRLDIVAGAAPAALAGLPAPDAVFIGGGVTVPGVVEACLAALKPGGRLVANAVTLEAETVLLDLYRRHGGELVRLAVFRAGAVGDFTGWRPQMPLTQWTLEPPCAE